MLHPRTARRLVTAAALSLVVAACGSNGSTDTSSPAAPQPAAPAPVETPAVPQHTFKDGDSVTIVVPTAPGGGFDTQARLVQPYFERQLREETGVNVSVRVEAMPGGGHLTGMQFVQQAAPDGRTLLYAGSNIGMGHQVTARQDLDMLAYTPIGPVGVNTLAFATRANLELPTRDFAGLVARSQEQPILMGHTGTEAQLRMMVGLLAEAGIDLRFDYVTLEGTSGVMTSLLRNEIEMGQISPPGAAPIVADNPGVLELFMGVGCSTVTASPETPTIVDFGAPQADIICRTLGEDWRIMYAPGGLSEGDSLVLTAALRSALADPMLQEELLRTGFDPDWLEPAEMTEYLASLITTWETLRVYAE